MPEFEQKTRSIFDRLHQSQGEDPYIFNRLVSLLSTEYLKVESNWFEGKTCLDAGCGSNANATYSMLRMGAERVYAFDLDSGDNNTILETVPRYLMEFEGRYELSLDDVLDMQYPDDFFDFTHCSGVLHSTRNVYQGLEELTRVTKPGGILYVMINGKGGLIREFTNLLRNKYDEDQGFKTLVDDLDAVQLSEIAQWIVSEMAAQGDESGRSIPPEILGQLFDQDLVLTIKDRIQAPVYHEHSEEELINWLTLQGFTGVERISRYPSYQNIRRILSPLYLHYDHPIAKLLFGSGVIQIKATKPAA